MAATSNILRRALLYVPSSSSKMLTKSRSLTVDNITYDLEDSVTPSQKPAARKAIREFLNQHPGSGIGEVAVRINAVETGLALDDLTEVLQAPNLDALVIPKVNSASDLHFVTDVLKHVLPARHPSSSAKSSSSAEPVKIIALIESARAVTDLAAICAASPYLSGLIFAAEDFAHDLSLTRTPSLTEFLYARSAIAAHARAASLPSTIDLVCTSFRGDEGKETLTRECENGKGMGFNGKQCIHPDQVPIVQRVFAPDEKEVEWSVRILIADEKASNAGRGAWTLDGKMIDVPVVRKAKAIVNKAEACGIDVDSVRSRWKDQEPE